MEIIPPYTVLVELLTFHFPTLPLFPVLAFLVVDYFSDKGSVFSRDVKVWSGFIVINYVANYVIPTGAVLWCYYKFVKYIAVKQKQSKPNIRPQHLTSPIATNSRLANEATNGEQTTTTAALQPSALSARVAGNSSRGVGGTGRTNLQLEESRTVVVIEEGETMA